MLHRAIVVVGLAAMAGCGSAPRPDDGKLTAATTILPHAWLVEQIGGDRVEVFHLVKPGESAELYQPSDAQISRVATADVYFRTGMPLENSGGFQTLRKLQTLKLVDLRDGIRLRDMVAHSHHEEEEGHAGHDHAGHDHGEAEGKDPHIWLSPPLLKTQARTVAQALISLDAANKAEYLERLRTFEKRLDDADAAIRATLDPCRGRAFLVFHPAWGYFAEEYGLRQMAIETEGKEPGDRELTAIQNLAREEKTAVVFVHPQGGRKSAEAVAAAIGGRVEVIDDLPPGDLLESLLATAKKIAAATQ